MKVMCQRVSSRGKDGMEYYEGEMDEYDKYSVKEKREAKIVKSSAKERRKGEREES